MLIICSHPFYFSSQASISASHLHILLQKEKRSFESQIADYVVKIQCLDGADREMKEEVVKNIARIRELEERIFGLQEKLAPRFGSLKLRLSSQRRGA